MKSKRMLATILTLSLTATLLVGCGGGSATTGTGENGKDADQYLNVVLGAEPKTLDTSKASDSYSSSVFTEIMEGLTRVEQEGEGENLKDVIKPAGAESWQTSEDGLTWTFKLRDQNWSDGKKVTANDYVYGLSRTLDPKTASQYSFLLYPIKNAEKVNTGKAPLEELGVKAIDDNTLEIKLEHPCSYFLQLTPFHIMEPQRKDIVEAHGDTYGSEPDTLVFNGPFKITSWTHNNEIVLEKNDTYWDKDKVNLQKVTMKIIKEETSRMNELYNGSLDMAGVSKPEWVKKFNETGKFDTLTTYDGATTYTFFNTKDKYFSNDKIRKAFIIAADREGTAKTLFRGLADPATGWCPPSVQINGEEFRSKCENYIDKLKKENPDPKALFVEGLKELGEDPDPSKHTIKYLQSGTDARSKEFAEFDQQNFNKTLGVNISIEYVEWPIFQKRTDEGDYELAGQGWSGDYNDPMTFFDLFLSTAKIIPTGWSNDKYDELIKTAQVSQDPAERIKAFEQAEKILIYDDAVISPMVFRKKSIYKAKYVKDVMSPLFGVADYKYAYTAGRK